MNKPVLFLFVCLAGILAISTIVPLSAEESSTSGAQWIDDGPPQGTYFYWYEPTYYTGFAPRCQEPERIHIRVARGNQVRVTIVLGDEQIDSYGEDLVLRRQIVDELIDRKILELTQNREYEAFQATLDTNDVAGLVSQKSTLTATEYRTRSLTLMSTLNPKRVFRIRLSIPELIDRWRKLIRSGSIELDKPQGKMALVNELVPGRINVLSLDQDQQMLLDQAMELAGSSDSPASSDAQFRETTIKLLDKIRGIRYVRNGDFLEGWEFTAIFPVGTAESWVSWQGKRLPAFSVTGVWPLIRRMKGESGTGMVDYISSNPGYGFVPMLPYQYAGGIAYNAFHNPGIRCPLPNLRILPDGWKRVPGIRDPKKQYNNLWIVSRGPVSHGCTRMSAGHILELRHILPSTSELLEKINSFHNLPQYYDVFDIDGDGTPEVMGVKYYLAYAHKKDRIPYKVYATNRREPFYAWLYSGEVRYDQTGKAVFDRVLSCTFAGRKAYEGRVYENITLWEAEYEHDRIQFFRIRKVNFQTQAGFGFIRELCRIGTGYVLNREKLFIAEKRQLNAEK